MSQKFFILVIMFGSLLVVHMSHAQSGLGQIEGFVCDSVSGNPAMFHQIRVMHEKEVVTGTTTDFDGYFRISALKPGPYTLEVSKPGLDTLISSQSVDVHAGIATTVSFHVEVIHVRMEGRGRAVAVTTAAGVQDNDGTIGPIRGTRQGQGPKTLDGRKVADDSDKSIKKMGVEVTSTVDVISHPGTSIDYRMIRP